MANAKYIFTSKNDRKNNLQQEAIFLKLYRYADQRDIFLMVLGTLAAIINGIILPLIAFVFGEVISAFISYSKYAHHQNYQPENEGNKTMNIVYNGGTSEYFDVGQNPNISEPPQDFMSAEKFLELTNRDALYYVHAGLAVSILTFIQIACWEMACSNQILRLKQVFFAQAMRQDVNWYEERENEDLTNKITDNMERMRDGLGSKVPVLFYSFSLLFSGLVIGFITNWKLTLVIMIGTVVLLISCAYTALIAAGVTQSEQLRYGIAGKIASEILTSLRTVSAFGGEKQEIERFSMAVAEGKKLTMKQYFFLSGGMGISTGVKYILYGVGLWYGSKLFLNEEILPGQIFTVFVSVATGALRIGYSIQNIIDISSALGAASSIFEIIDNVPQIDPYSKKGQMMSKLKGEIEFKNVYFSYPTRPQVMVLSDLNLTIPAGKCVAVVGSSGAGKSTLVSLILRFYDPLCGKILVDDVDVSDLNIQNFRQQIGVVSQEPVLFDVTIEENIRHGNPSATRAEIEEAAKISFAHTFIESFPSGYNTLVGERGVQLSGGQKQRIAIARAILRNPKILLLDEATSALDAHSETVVQAALENAAKGRTTLIIAHRLSTVKNADIIYAMKNGQLAESGTHEELMAKKGTYYHLVLAQTKKTNETGEPEKQEEPEKNFKEPMKRMLSFKRFSLKRFSMKKFSEAKVTKDEEVSYFKLLAVTRSPILLVVGVVAYFIAGLHIPTFAFLYGGIVDIFVLPEKEFVESIALWSISFFFLAFITSLSMASAVLSSSIFTENMIKVIRIETFRNIISQQLSFFDEDEYSPIKLTNSLAKYPPLVKGIAGVNVGFFIITGVTTIFSLALLFYCGWRLALIILCFVPIILLGNWFQMRLKYQSFIQECENTARATKMASECFQNIKTVQFLCLQEHMLSIFMSELKKSHKDGLKQIFIFAASFALVHEIVFFMMGCTAKFGSEFVVNGYSTNSDVFRTVFAVMFASNQLVSSLLFIQDFSKAKVAISEVYKLMIIPTKLDIFSKEGEQPMIHGTIEFRDVYFSYPSQSHVDILRGLSLRIPQGKTVALVGGSGCGKSTLINLLERFYNIKKGEILIDGVNIEKINVNYLRSQIGLVTQEPTLFDTTIKENICYGMSNLGKEVTSQEIIDAAKAANIHEFIANLPEGYETKVGERGSKLSGGQKQRIALARALLRNPKILLLDEATSALDAESEKVVQDALDNARQGRTSFVIAHRLSTVKNADLIAVIADGRVVEQGTHQRLLELKGHYYDLVKHQ